MPAVDARILFVKINRMQPTDGPQEIYDRTRGHWKVSARGRESVEYAAGVIRGVYRVDRCFPSEVPGDVRRWGFHGEPAPELAHIVGTHVRHLFSLNGSQNPVSYYWPGKEAGARRPW